MAAQLNYRVMATLYKDELGFHVVLPTGRLLCGRYRRADRTAVRVPVNTKSQLLCVDCRHPLYLRASRAGREFEWAI